MRPFARGEAPSRRLLYSCDYARLELRGRGFLGFGTVRRWDAARRAETITTYDHATRVGTAYPTARLERRLTRREGPQPPRAWRAGPCST